MSHVPIRIFGPIIVGFLKIFSFINFITINDLHKGNDWLRTNDLRHYWVQNEVFNIEPLTSSTRTTVLNDDELVFVLVYVHTAKHQAIQNQNKLIVDCTGTLYKASSST